eukprot:3514548-Prymnesium_polylepis.1
MTGFRPAPYDVAESGRKWQNSDMHTRPRGAAVVERDVLNWEWAGPMDRATLVSSAYGRTACCGPCGSPPPAWCNVPGPGCFVAGSE